MRSRILMIILGLIIGCGDSPVANQLEGELAVVAPRDIVATGDSLLLRVVVVDQGAVTGLYRSRVPCEG